MKKFLLVLFALISINVFAQSDSFKVKEGSFHHVQGCVTIPAHTDQNDLPMGVIKIITDNINEQQRAKLRFEGNLAMGIEVEQHEGETWVYVTARAATFLRIKHPDFGVTEFNIPMEIEANKCYEMTLQYVNNQPEYGFLAISSEPTDADIYIDGKHYGKTNNVITDLAVGTHKLKLEKEGYSTVTKTFVTTKGETLKLNETLQAVVNKKTYLIVQADQADAIVYIDGEMLGAKEARKLVDDGTTHTYKIECKLYHEESGTVTIKDKTVVNKTLRPAFGYLNISSTPEQDANVWVDGDLIGVTPIKTDKLASGTHTVRVMKDMYKMKEQSFTVTDGQTTNATLNMSANFVTLTLTVDAVSDSDSDADTDTDADIYVDEEYKGKGKWTGRLSEGAHIFEARKANHKPSKKSLDLVLGENKTITLDAPTPINGTIDIDSSPMGATIYIDGKHYGETPNYISDILIGEHELKLTKQGCAEIKKTIIIKEGETLTINEKLQTGKEISISTDQYGDKIYVDGNYIGTSPISSNLSYGSHEIKAERNGKTVSKTINVAQSGGETNIKLTFFGNQTFTVNGVSFTMIAVEGGTFQMGATSEQGSDAESDERPVHSVTLSDYYIGETEVTQELWEAVMGSKPSRFSGYPQRPVENVSWKDCQEFITKLNNLTGKNFRLPTEAEWEYAARGGNKSQGYKYSGSNTIGNVAWYTSNSSWRTYAYDVKTKQANELGIYDMSGNVREWCQDWYGNYSSSSQTSPAGPSSGSTRVIRGGSWDCDAGRCRVSYRYGNYPDDGYDSYGFRLVSDNFVNVTINTDSQSDIYVDEEYKGKGEWTGCLSVGSHIVEARKANHKTSVKSMDLVWGESKTITLDAPKPINGTLEVNTSPMGANVYIDGKNYGQTPNRINKIVIGSHALKLEKQGCVSITKTINIKEGDTLTINENLQAGKEISISTGKSGDKIYVDGNYIGISPIISSLSYGSHEIKAERAGMTVSKTITVAQTGGDNSVKMSFGNPTLTVNGVSFTMIAVDGGTFQMGATSEQGSDAESYEKPVHSVTLSDYYIGETEVTQELWMAVMGNNPSFSKDSQQPVETVSWNDCQEFITKLNNLTGMTFRLPTEAEWEYAARGGNKSQSYKYSGSDNVYEVAWYNDNSSSPHNVKTNSPNELGIYDMSGNVYEWCQDYRGSYSSGSQTNPKGPSSGFYRVLRGGSYASYARKELVSYGGPGKAWRLNECRVSNRGSGDPRERSEDTGFRLVLQ